MTAVLCAKFQKDLSMKNSATDEGDFLRFHLSGISTGLSILLWVNFASGNGSLSGGIKPLHKPMLTYHQRCFASFTWDRFHKRRSWTQSSIPPPPPPPPHTHTHTHCNTHTLFTPTPTPLYLIYTRTLFFPTPCLARPIRISSHHIIISGNSLFIIKNKLKRHLIKWTDSYSIKCIEP